MHIPMSRSMVFPKVFVNMFAKMFGMMTASDPKQNECINKRVNGYIVIEMHNIYSHRVPIYHFVYKHLGTEPSEQII